MQTLTPDYSTVSTIMTVKNIRYEQTTVLTLTVITTGPAIINTAKSTAGSMWLKLPMVKKLVLCFNKIFFKKLTTIPRVCAFMS